MNFRPLVLTCSLLLASAIGQARAENLIQNGNFQHSSVGAGTFQYANGYGPYPGPLQVPGWALGGGAGVANHSEDWGGQASTETVAFLQIFQAYGIDNPQASQTFASQGGNLTFGFDLAQRPYYSMATLDVYFDNQRLAYNLLPASTDWQHYQFTLNGLSAGNHTIRFLAHGAPDEDSSVYLSHVSVTAVPEPESWALMLAGLAGLGWLARRKRAMHLH